MKTGTTMNENTKSFAVVTGASTGIGLELSKEFARNGYDLLIVADEARINEAAAQVRNAGASEVEAVQADLSKPEGVEEVYRRIQATGRPVAAIALNAGIGVGGDFVRETTLDKNLKVVDLNVRSTVHLARLVLNEMVREGNGKVLFTSSIAATMPGTFDAVYNASKAFIQSFAQAIRAELKDTGVTITALMPGATETEFFHRAGMDDTKVGQATKDDPAQVAREGFKAMMDGKDHVIAGAFMNKVQATMAHVLPDPMVAEMHRKQAEHQSR